MRILMSSHCFAPSVGGIETVGRLLAREFLALGHEIRVVTQTLEKGEESFPYPILRGPTRGELWKEVRWCDLFFHNNISLQTAWPLLAARKPWVITHHTWISRADGSRAWPDHLKQFLLRFGVSVSISTAIARHLSVPSKIIPDPFQDDVFRPIPGTARSKPLIFVGRLVSDKGVDLLVKALGKLRKRALTPELTVVGAGPELPSLRELAAAEGVQDQIQFTGSKSGPELARLLNQHSILITPSRWNEPFGVVALEGIGCGCVVVGSSGGGLGDAIGPCGITFENGNVEQLATALERLLRNPSELEIFRKVSTRHVEKHRARAVAAEYLKLFQTVLEGGKIGWDEQGAGR
jgi:glycogen(starch) synthase